MNVVFFHIISTASSYSQSSTTFQFLKGWGASGVDVFFVISGFVMLHTQMIKRKSPLEFVKGRLIRIVPIYWVLTLFVASLFYLFPLIFRTLDFTRLQLFSSLFFVSSVFVDNGPIIYVGWSLEWEVLFYLFFAIALFSKTWRSFGLVVALSLTLVAVFTKSSIVLEFLLGTVFAFLLHYKTISKKVGLIVFLVGFLLLALSLIPAVKSFEINRFFKWGIPSFFIVLGLVYSSQVSNSLLVYLGGASYSIYLVQMLSIPLFYKLSSKLLVGWSPGVLALACLVFSVSFGCFVYSFIEKPITVRLRSFV